MVTREAIIETARRAVGTPYQHAGRVLGPQGGMDCAGLLAWVGKELGYVVNEDLNYPTQGLLDLMVGRIEEYYIEWPVDLAETGDIFVFNSQKLPHHVGIFTGPKIDSMIHIWQGHGGCVEMPLNDWWKGQIFKAFSLKEFHPEWVH